MIKRIMTGVLALVFVCCLSFSAHCIEIPSRDDMFVEYTSGGEMNSNFNTEGNSFSEYAKELQPGDFIVYSIRLTNRHSGESDWYMKNEVINSLEKASNTARGGAYTYILSYINPDRQTEELYNSATVGGEDEDTVDDTEGLKEATNALKDYFFLDTLKSGDNARITLLVELDGETQGNDYQDTLADLRMQFAVEQQGEGTRTVVVKTGDTTNLWWLYVLFIISGILLLWLALDALRKRRKEDERNAKA